MHYQPKENTNEQLKELTTNGMLEAMFQSILASQ